MDERTFTSMTYGEPVAAACSNESAPWGTFQTISENAFAYSVNAPRPLTESREQRLGRLANTYPCGGHANNLSTYYQ